MLCITAALRHEQAAPIEELDRYTVRQPTNERLQKVSDVHNQTPGIPTIELTVWCYIAGTYGSGQEIATPG